MGGDTPRNPIKETGALRLPGTPGCRSREAPAWPSPRPPSWSAARHPLHTARFGWLQPGERGTGWGVCVRLAWRGGGMATPLHPRVPAPCSLSQLRRVVMVPASWHACRPSVSATMRSCPCTSHCSSRADRSLSTSANSGSCQSWGGAQWHGSALARRAPQLLGTWGNRRLYLHGDVGADLP